MKHNNNYYNTKGSKIHEHCHKTNINKPSGNSHSLTVYLLLALSPHYLIMKFPCCVI